ncbi:patatin-like phospholipase family protein [Thiomicrorhabdus sediminis]|uniref:Serine protease n=1 Tax=Thiomicrorhabdus sediminis TaxID=2580412 RepID=A0A4P9K4C5_9GAMM|nr:patatin-like phospholipase family protein [Thiomicrorhabdus sediminis]QCU89814.1 serine protease [Thiomicrorhabdus sediminis]
MPNSEKTVSLVLGSGGARGLAHIGVIHWLEEHQFTIKSVSGASIGALVGGVYAAGQLSEFEQWARNISKVEILRLLDLSWKKGGLVKGDKLIDSLKQLVGDLNIEDLEVNFTAVATNIEEEKEVWLNSGNLFDAIRASISLPLFFTPFQYHGNYLIDGGVLNPVPIAPTFQDATDLTIAVNLGGKASQKTTKISANDKQESVDFLQKFRNFFQGAASNRSNTVQTEWAAYEIANLAFDSMQSAIARQKLAAYPADHLIQVSRDACGILEFDRTDEMIELGYNMAEKSLSGQL